MMIMHTSFKFYITAMYMSTVVELYMVHVHVQRNANFMQLFSFGVGVGQVTKRVSMTHTVCPTVWSHLKVPQTDVPG